MWQTYRRSWAAGLVGLWMVLSAGAPAALAGPGVATVQVQAAAVASGHEMDGVVQAVRQSTLSAQVGGRVMSLSVKAGDRVRAGQVLAVIDDREAQVGLQGSQARVAQSEADLAQARLNLERNRQLFAQGFLSKAALDAADMQHQAAVAGRDQAKAGAGQSALTQGHTRVTAPYDGWVQQTLAEPGDLALPGKPLLTVYAPQPLRVVVQLPASRMNATGAGPDTVEVLLPDGGAVLPSQRQLLPLADSVSQTQEWRLELPPAASQGLVPGQQLRVRLGSGVVQRQLVPASAVLRRGELSAVYVWQGGQFALRMVRLGADHGAHGVAVLAGLKPGERVAVDAVRAGLAGAQAQ